MTDTLERALRASTDHLVLDTPSTDVVARGDRIKRRRRTRTAAACAGGLAAVTVSVGVLVPPDPAVRLGPSTPTTATAAPAAPAAPGRTGVLSWRGTPTTLSDADLETVRTVCGSDLPPGDRSQDGWALARTHQPAAAERRDDLVLAYFSDGARFLTCTLDGPAGRAGQAARTEGVVRAVAPGRAVDLVTSGAADPGALGGAVADAYAVLGTDPTVAAVEVVVAGQRFAGPARDGLAFVWLPDGRFTAGDLEDARVTARDDSGAVVGAPGGISAW